MPDPNPADSIHNIPNLPLNFEIDLVTHDEINCGWMWAIDRAGRIPQGTHGYVVKYEKIKDYSGKDGLKKIFAILDAHTPQFGPQPAFKVTTLSKIPEFGVDTIHETLEPNTEYFLAFASFNEAGRSHYFGTFNYQEGIITSVKTKEAPNV